MRKQPPRQQHHHLTASEQEELQERAAILEYEANLPRERAEREAETIVRLRAGKLQTELKL